MFTGLVKDIGIVRSTIRNQEGMLLVVESKKIIRDIEIDDSVAINGACQTVVKIDSDAFWVQTVHTSLEKTTLGSLRPGENVNLELALRASDRLGGHIVQGHINDVGKIVAIKSTGNNYIFTVEIAAKQMRYVINEGSVSIDGVSLTVANTRSEFSQFSVSVIPHTYFQTIFHHKKVGSPVNIEVDIVGKYIENLLFHGPERKNGNSKKEDSISLEWLESKGY